MKEEKKEQKTVQTQTDWEWDPQYCGAGEEKELSLEDFIEDAVPSKEEGTFADDRLSRTVEDVERVLELEREGRTTEEIARCLELDRQYVYDIQVCAQGFREDDVIAVAHLVMMS